MNNSGARQTRDRYVTVPLAFFAASLVSRLITLFVFLGLPVALLAFVISHETPVLSLCRGSLERSRVRLILRRWHLDPSHTAISYTCCFYKAFSLQVRKFDNIPNRQKLSVRNGSDLVHADQFSLAPLLLDIMLILSE